MTQKYTAIVTGASSGIGRAISEKLGVLGYEVFGIGRRFDTEEDRDIAGVLQYENDLKNAIFHPIICDLTDTDKLCAIVKQITSEHTVKVLVNNAGAAYYGLHEELNPKKIQEMVRVNLEAPLILTQQLLRTLKKKRRLHYQYLICHGETAKSARLCLCRNQSRTCIVFVKPV